MTTITNNPTAAHDTAATIRTLIAPRRLLVIAFVLGWLFDWAFYDKSLGLSVLLYAGALAGALTYAGWVEDIRPKRHTLWLLIPMAAFGMMAFVRANEFLTFLNVCAVLLLLMLYAYYFSAENILTQSIFSYIVVPLKMMTTPWFSGFRVITEARLAAQEDETSHQLPIMPIVRGLLIALPILLMFTGLLVSADLIFAQRLEEWFQIPDFAELFTRFLLIGWISWLMLGALAYGLTRGWGLLSAEQQAKVGAEPIEKKQFLSLGFIESSIVLGTVNLLFVVFVAIQFAYLFGGLNNIKIDGYTFAEYARKGFFELVMVAILVLAMLLILKWLSRRETARQELVFKALSSVMVALVTVMLISAYKRMSLYEWTYGFSELRLYSHVFIVWLGIALAWFVVTLWLRPERFTIGLFIAALGFVMTLNIINPDATIVRQNWSRFELMEPYLTTITDDLTQVSPQIIRGVSVENARSNPNLALDMYYLTRLSNDAVPELLKIKSQLSVDDHSYLTEDLRARAEWLAAWDHERVWQSYHWTHARTLRLLSAEFPN